jgi:hypothetical protein
VCVCVCLPVCINFLSHLALKSHIFGKELYCQLQHVRLYYIFPSHLINGLITANKNITEYKTCLNFLYKLYLKYFSLQSTRCCCQILIKFAFFGRVETICQIIKFHENPSHWNRRTDGQTHVTKVILSELLRMRLQTEALFLPIPTTPRAAVPYLKVRLRFEPWSF